MKHLRKCITNIRLKLAEVIGGRWYRNIVAMSKYYVDRYIETKLALDERDEEYDRLFEEWAAEKAELLKKIAELEGGDTK